MANLKSKDFWGGRALLDGEVDMVRGSTTLKLEKMQPSMFSMVANSAVVEVYIITKYDVDFLIEHVKQLLHFCLKHTYEVD